MRDTGLGTSIDARLRRSALVRVPLNLYRHRGLTGADTLLVSYPKSGNTWLKFMLGVLLAGEVVDFDTSERIVASIGDQRHAPPLTPGGGRIVKSHEPYRRSVPSPPVRAIHLVRDGRDVAVSYFHALARKGHEFAGFSAYLEAFLRGDVDPYGPWGDHVESWLGSPAAAEGLLLTLRYEDMLADPVRELARVASFLSVEAGDAELRAAVEANTADRMRERERDSEFHRREGERMFVRAARAGQWHEVFSDADARRFEERFGSALARAGYR
jgi:hypothetical protein